MNVRSAAPRHLPIPQESSETDCSVGIEGESSRDIAVHSCAVAVQTAGSTKTNDESHRGSFTPALYLVQCAICVARD